MNTKQEIVYRLNEANNEESKMNRVHRYVSVLLFQNEGKKGDRWFEKRAKKYFAELGWECRFSGIAGQNYLHVWGGDSDYSLQNDCRIFLGYDSDLASLSQVVFEERSRCSGSAAEDRISRRNILLKDESWLNRAVMRIESFQQAKKALEEFMGESYQNEAFYIIRELAGLVEKR
jgi:hypothetical protein